MLGIHPRILIGKDQHLADRADQPADQERHRDVLRRWRGGRSLFCHLVIFLLEPGPKTPSTSISKFLPTRNRGIFFILTQKLELKL